MDLIEHPHAREVERQMSRARAILVSLIPALLLAAALDCFSETLSGCGCVGLGCLMAAKARTDGHRRPAANLADQAVLRWSRRISFQAGADELASPATLATRQLDRPEQISGPVYFPIASADLAQSWQFRWRTALEPRAPSLAS